MSCDDAIVRQAASSTQGCNEAQTAFLQWFHAAGGSLSKRCRFADYATMGTGMVAAETLENDELLFAIPRHMLLNVRNSRLPAICRAFDAQDPVGQAASSKWDDVNVGWHGLMMTMMWEQFRATSDGEGAWTAFVQRSTDQPWMYTLHDGINAQDQAQAQAALTARANMGWGPYFGILPDKFDTPMFWNDADLAELKGTSIIDKVGKAEATAGYVDMVRPYIRARPQLFLGTSADDTSAIEALIDRYYSLNQFHIMGSRILSRSFHVKGDEGVGEGQGEGQNGDASGQADDTGMGEDTSDGEESDEEEDDEGQESIEDVSMVPMADMLNARYGHDNARLYYRAHVLEMRATRRIEAGEQVWNTYGEPPSSDLLRRYGYVDLGNPADVVELVVEELVAGRMELPASPSRDALLKRMEWACALGMDEVSALTYPFPPSSTPPYRPSMEDMSKRERREAALHLPEDILVLARVLCLDDASFDKAHAKDKLPNPRIDAVEELDGGHQVGVAPLLLHAIEAHRRAYTTTIEQDEQLLFGTSASQAEQLHLNRRQAIVIRLSEKRILADTEKILHAVIEAVAQKRKQDAQSGSASSHKKARKV